MFCTDESLTSCECFEAAVVNWHVVMCETNGMLVEAVETANWAPSDASVTECPMAPGTTDSEAACGCDWEAHGSPMWIDGSYKCVKCWESQGSLQWIDGAYKCVKCDDPGQEYRWINGKARCFEACADDGWLTDRWVPSDLTCEDDMVLGWHSGAYKCYECPAGLGRVEYDHARQVMKCYLPEKASCSLPCYATSRHDVLTYRVPFFQFGCLFCEDHERLVHQRFDRKVRTWAPH